MSSEEQKFLNGQYVFVLANGMGKNRLDLFKNALSRYGARLIDENETQFTLDLGEAERAFIIVDENTMTTFANVQKALEKKKFYLDAKKKGKANSFQVLKSLWLSECIKQKCMVDISRFEIIEENRINSNLLAENVQNTDENKQILNKSGLDVS